MAAAGALTLCELTRQDLPSSPEDPQYAPWVDSVVSAALRLVDSLSSGARDPAVWSAGKLHNGAQTYSTRSVQIPPPGSGDTEGFKWHARKSIHDATIDKVSYAHFERGLLRDHSVNESKYIESCTEAKLIDVVKSGELEGEFVVSAGSLIPRLQRNVCTYSAPEIADWSGHNIPVPALAHTVWQTFCTWDACPKPEGNVCS